MTREYFLTQLWKRYPVVPGDVSHGEPWLGRVCELSRENEQFEVSLERNGEISLRQFQKLFLREAPEVALESIFKILAPGDYVAILKSGEVILLAPQLASLPSRSFQPQNLELWQNYLRLVRAFFCSHGFLEISTPTLVQCPGTEPTLSPFVTEFNKGSQRERLYLPTSPELHLKKALALGAEKVFEIRQCFRNEEVTEIHQPEFTMIEWYRAFNDLTSIRNDVENLIYYLVKNLPGLRAPHGSDVFSVAELFQRECGFSFTPQTSLKELKSLAETLGVDVKSATTVDDCFFLLFLEKIESSMNPGRMTFVEKYPPYQAALARISEEGWGERFEMYWQGLEIANAFHELNDPEIQKARFTEDLAKKKLMKKEVVNLDSEFMQCLEAGMPPASGIALGIDRLFMALTGIQQIALTRLFPIQ